MISGEGWQCLVNGVWYPVVFFQGTMQPVQNMAGQVNIANFWSAFYLAESGQLDVTPPNTKFRKLFQS